MVRESSSGGALNQVHFGNGMSLRSLVKVIEREVGCDKLFLGDVLIESNLNCCVVVELYLTCVKSLLFGVVEDCVEGISLSKFLNENTNWDSLLPELDISN